MRRRAALILTAAAACCALAAGAGTATAAVTAAPAGHLGNAQQITGLNNLNAGGLADVSSVSCGSPGNCVAGGTYLFALPGSPGACRDGWDEILRWQLDNRHRPCNFVELMPRLQEHLTAKPKATV